MSSSKLRKENTMKRILPVLICLTILISLSGITSVSALSDVPDNLEEPIRVLQMLGVVSGYPDGTFRPNRALTRAEFCKMAVELLGEEKDLPLYENFTIFMDVKSSHWAVGYVNLASRSLKLLVGYPDGTFRPDEPITYAQAVTILVRALGYSDADVGLSWPSGYLNKAKAIGLTTDLTGMTETSTITRGSGARLFYNTLLAQKKDGSDFIGNIGSVEKNVIILDNKATATDGSKGAVLVDGYANPIKSRNPMPDSFCGMRGTLVLDDTGWIKVFLPGDATQKTFILKQSLYPYLEASTGEKHRLSADTPVFVDGEKRTYLEISYDLTPGTAIDIYYTSAGLVDYVFANSPTSSGNAVVLVDTPSYSGLLNMFGASSGATIYKNGSVASIADLRPYDVVMYNKSANIFTVNDFKLSGIYTNAYPNTSVPSKITILGKEFNVRESAIESLSRFYIGDAITLMFDNEMQVVGAAAQTALRESAIGIYTGAGVVLSNKTELNVAPESNSGIKPGMLVQVYSAIPNYISIREVRDTNPGLAVDMNKGMVGDKEIAGNAVFYEKVGSDGAVERLNHGDIVTAVIPADKVRYVGYDSSGRANVIVLDDVTGDLYEYGKLYSDTEEVYTGGWTVSNPYSWVVNSNGESEHYLCTLALPKEGTWAGIAHNLNGRATKVVELTEYKGLTRRSFVDGSKLDIGGVLTPISEDVHIYVEAIGSYMSASSFEQLIIDARAFGESFVAYTDRSPSEGGKVRVIIVK
jgi:hypothetical protein